MNKSLAPLLAVLVGVVVAILFGVLIGEGNFRLAIVLIVVLIGLLFFALIGRSANGSSRLLTVILAGYLIAGKGFAYLSPVAPFFIGEVFIILLLGSPTTSVSVVAFAMNSRCTIR